MSDVEENGPEQVKKQNTKEKKPKKRREEKKSGENEEEAVSQQGEKRNKKKRKREEVQLTEEEIAAAKAERSRKKWKKRDAKAAAKSEASRTEKAENPIQFRAAKVQRNFLWTALQSMKEVKSMTSMELEDMVPPDHCFAKPTREEWGLGELSEVLLEALENSGAPTGSFLCEPKSPQDAFGAPIVLIVARTAIRCVELIKHLMTFRKFAHFASLFAKHKKASEQLKFLQEYHCQLAIGTPNRIREMFDAGALKGDRLKLIVFDAQMDAKAVSVLDAFETRTELLHLYKDFFMPLVSKDQTKFALL